MNGTSPHIVQYQGSKRMLAPQIMQYIHGRYNRMIEPFAGMAAMTIAVAQQRKADQFLVNDLNAPLVSILSAAVDNPSGLVQDYEKVWRAQFDYPEGSVAHFYKVREDFNSGDKCAANMLYLLARCVKGSVRYGSNGAFNQSPDKRRNGTKPETLAPNVYAISRLLKNRTVFQSVDYRDVLSQAMSGDLVYMDPPYQGVCSTRDSRYLSGIEFESFVEAIDDLNSRGIDFLISYDGTCGSKQYGEDLPAYLGLHKVLLRAGLSSQSLFLGKKELTYEALYISPRLYEESRTANHPTLFAEYV